MSKYNKLSPALQEIAKDRDLLIEQGADNSLVGGLNRAIINQLLIEFPQMDTRGNKSFEHDGKNVPSKHTHLGALRTRANQKKADLLERWVIEPVKTLLNENRRNEVVGTALSDYTQLLFTNRDIGEYYVRVKNDVQPNGVLQYLEEQDEIIDAQDRDISQLTDEQLKRIFSSLTTHKREQFDEFWKQNNSRIYRNHAVYHIDELKDVFKSLEPLVLMRDRYGEVPYKIGKVTVWPWAWKYVEFRYHNFFTKKDDQKIWRRDKDVYIVIHDSRDSCKKKLEDSIASIAEKKSRLTLLLEEKRFLFAQNAQQTNSDWRREQREVLEKEVSTIYNGVYIQEMQSRFQQTNDNEKYMNHYTYAISTDWMLTLIQKSIDELTAVWNRLQQYAKAEW